MSGFFVSSGGRNCSDAESHADKTECVDEYLWAMHGLLAVTGKKYCNYTCLKQLLSLCLT